MVSTPKRLIFVLAVLSFAARSESNTITVDFSTDATAATVGTVYPAWAFIPANGSDAATVSVESGQLQLGGTQSDPTLFQFLTAPVGAFTIDLDLGAYPGNGSVNVGVLIGENEIVFHPGFPGTSVRVEGAGGFGNQNTGFTLAAETLHHLTLTGDGAGLFTITLIDGLNASNSYTNSFTNVASVGGLFSITRAGAPGVYGEVHVDNFVFTDGSITAVPDSSSTFTLSLFGLGALVVRQGLTRYRRT